MRWDTAKAAGSLRAPWRAYLVAVVAGVAAVGVAAALQPLIDEPTYVPLVAATAIAAWYGGPAAGLLSVAVGWLLAFFLVAPPRESVSIEHNEFVRWLVALAVGLLVVWFAWLARRSPDRP